MKKIDKIMDIIEKICLEICMVLLVVIVAEIFLQVIIRKLGFSVTWVDEASRYCYILMILCGSGAVMRKGAHIRVTSFIDLVPARIRKVTEVLTFLLVAERYLQTIAPVFIALCFLMLGSVSSCLELLLPWLSSLHELPAAMAVLPP